MMMNPAPARRLVSFAERVAPLALLIFLAGSSANAALVSSTMTFQGSLKQSGVPVNGTYTIELDVTDSSGTACWLGTPQSVTVTDGLYRMDIAPTFDNCPNTDLYIRTKINGSTLSPSERITSAPFALMARSLSGGATVQGNLQINGALSTVGNIGIGTAASDSNVTVSSGTARLLLNSTSSTGYSMSYLVSDVSGGAGMSFRTFGSAFAGNDDGRPLAGFGLISTDGALQGIIVDPSNANGLISFGIGGSEKGIFNRNGLNLYSPTYLGASVSPSNHGVLYIVGDSDTSQGRMLEMKAPWPAAWQTDRYYLIGSNTNGTVNFYVRGDGAYYSSSSRALKEDIRPIDHSLDLVSKIQGCRYNWKGDQTGKDNVGFIAEDLAQVLPEAVAPDGKLVNYSAVVPVLVESVKELKAQMDARDQTIAALETRLSALEKSSRGAAQ